MGWGGEWDSIDPTEPHLDPPLYMYPLKVSAKHDVALHV